MGFKCDHPAVPTPQVDDEVSRITRWDFAPGAVTGWHRHAFPYFVIMLTDGTLRVRTADGDSDTTLKAGDSYRRPEGVEHDVMNASDHPIAFVEVEVKRPNSL